MAGKKQSNRDAWQAWASKDLWSHAEFSEICAGLVPGHPNKTGDELARVNQASEDISRGVRAGVLPFVPRSDEDAASRLYGTHRHYRPAEACEWARVHFDRFPAQLLDAVKAVAATRATVHAPTEKPLDARERASLLCIIGALVKETKLDLSQPMKAANAIAAMMPGVKLSGRAIGEHLKAVREAMDSRTG